MEKFTPGDLLARLHNRSGRCSDCGAEVELIRVAGMPPFCPPVCNACVEAHTAKTTQARKSERMRAWFASTGFARASYDEARTKGIRTPESMHRMAHTASPWSLHVGPTGTGKTTALMLWCVRQARAALNADVEARMPSIQYVTEESAFRQLGGKQRDGIAERWRGCDMLIIDDCGAFAGSARECTHLSSILIDRYAARSQVALATNHDIATLIQSPAAPMWDVRMLERIDRKSVV